MNHVEIALKKTGACLSSELADELVSTYRISREAARQRISRGGPNVHKLKGLPFPRRALFLYLKEDYRSNYFWKALFRAFKITKSAYWPAIAAIDERGGIIPYRHFLISCGSPLKQQKHIPPETILKRLELHKICSVKVVEGVGKCIYLTRYEDDLDFIQPAMKARLCAEQILISAISTWVKNLGLVSYNLLKTRDCKDLPIVSTTAWDIAGPSYLSPLIQLQKEGKAKSGFFACDVLLDTRISESGLMPFLRKCNSLRSLPKVGKCMQMFVADSYQSEAFDSAKAAGIIPATVDTLFGKEVAEGLKTLIKTMVDLARMILVEPEKFDYLFESIGKIEGASGHLRGALFEYFTASVIKKVYNVERILLNQEYKTKKGEKAESDIVVDINNGPVVFVECKGHQPLGFVDIKEVEKWIQKRIPRLRSYALEHPDWKHRKLRFELWTTGKFNDESMVFIAEAKQRTSKYEMNFLDAIDIQTIIKNSNDGALLSTFHKYFYNHPIKKIERWKY